MSKYQALNVLQLLISLKIIVCKVHFSLLNKKPVWNSLYLLIRWNVLADCWLT